MTCGNSKNNANLFVIISISLKDKLECSKKANIFQKVDNISNFIKSVLHNFIIKYFKKNFIYIF